MKNSEIFIGALFSAYHTVVSKRAYLDEINVFPVPDYDAGTNFCRTLKAGADAVKGKENLGVLELFEKASKAMLRNARGNSGVIISALFKGFSDYMNSLGSFSVPELSNAFDSALKGACGVIGRPVFKGTVLSVVMTCRDALLKNKFENAKEAFSFLKPVAETALEKTGKDLEAAKNAGVVDSGAAGLFLIIETIERFLSKRAENVLFPHEPEKAQENVIFKKLSPAKKSEYTYCAEFLVFKNAHASAKELEEKLLPLGDCVIVASNGEIIRVRLNTNDPGTAMKLSSAYGVLTDIKIDNLQMQKTFRQGES